MLSEGQSVSRVKSLSELPPLQSRYSIDMRSIQRLPNDWSPTGSATVVSMGTLHDESVMPSAISRKRQALCARPSLGKGEAM